MKIEIIEENNLRDSPLLSDIEEKMTIRIVGRYALELQPRVLEAIVKTCMEQMTAGEWEADLTVSHPSLKV